MFIPHEQNAGHNHHRQTAIKPFENVAKLKYVKIPLTIKTLFKRELRED